MAIDFDLAKVRGCTGFKLREVMSEEKADEVRRRVATVVFAHILLKNEQRGKFEFTVQDCLEYAPIEGVCEYNKLDAIVQVYDLRVLVDFKDSYALPEAMSITRLTTAMLRYWNSNVIS